MNVKELIAALQALGPEYEESMVLVNTPGMGGAEEAMRIITIPELTNVHPHYSWEIFEKVVYIVDSPSQFVSKNAESEGWKVPYCNPIRRTPSPPKPPEIIVRQPVCRKCIKVTMFSRPLQKLVPYHIDTCAVCEEQIEVVATF